MLYMFEYKYNTVLQFVCKQIMTIEHTLVNNFYSPNLINISYCIYM